MTIMTATDWAILEFLSADPQPIRDLLDGYPKATLYARLRVLQGKGLVAKRSSQYLLTTAGLQGQAERAGAPRFDGLGTVYPPLRETPSPQHRAMDELAIGALVVRQRTDQMEHHASFLFVGPPLSGKSVSGYFLCLVAGADPDTCVVDLAAESGRSMWVRRGAAGDIRSQRALLSGPVIVLDEFGLADRAVRQAVAPFLSGRRRIPFENEILSITPVPIITMNPRPGDTLSARTGCSLAQLRRVVPCDLSAVPLPDLALEGGRAIDAARVRGPLILRPPRASCETFRAAVVRLLRRTLVPEAVGLVDVELLLGLARGLTGWLTPAVAMRQALYDFLLVIETVNWVRPGWLEAVRAFPDPGEGAGSSRAGLDSVTQVPGSAQPPQTISLFPDRMTPNSQKERPGMSSRDSVMPTFTLSERTKGLLVALAIEAPASLDLVVETLIIIRRMHQTNDITLQDLLAVIQLREACATAEIAVSDLRTAVELTAGLRQWGLTLDRIQTVLQIAEDLTDAGLSLHEARRVADLMKALKKAGIDPRAPDQLDAALQRYAALGYEAQSLTRLAVLWERLERRGLGLDDLAAVLARLDRLTDLGLDGDMAEALATMLGLADVAETQRGEVLAKAVELGEEAITLVQVRADRDARQEEVQRLQIDRAALQLTLAAEQDQLARIRLERDQVQHELAALRDQRTYREDAIASAQALEGFLLSNPDVTDAFFARMVVVRDLRRRRSPHSARIESTLTAATQQRVLDFLKRICRVPLPPTATPGEAMAHDSGGRPD